MTRTEEDLAPDAGGNSTPFDDGRDAQGRLPEPLDAAYFGTPGGPVLDLPGMPLSQPAGTGAVVSSPVLPEPAAAEDAQAADGVADAALDEQPPADKPTGLATMPRATG